MLKSNIELNVRNANKHASIIDVKGDLNGYAEDSLMDALTLASSNGVGNIILNFEELDFMNSSGIGVLVTMLIRVKRENQHLLAYGLSQHYEQIFKLTRLDEAILLFPGEAQAVAAIN
jgi:anti-sigma B factor antagonist